MEKLKQLASMCKASCSLEWRCGADYYETLKQAIEKGDSYYCDEDDFLSAEDRVKCMETDEYWTIHFYPDTPIGFYKFHGSDCNALVEQAISIIKRDRGIE